MPTKCDYYVGRFNPTQTYQICLPVGGNAAAYRWQNFCERAHLLGGSVERGEPPVYCSSLNCRPSTGKYSVIHCGEVKHKQSPTVANTSRMAAAYVCVTWSAVCVVTSCLAKSWAQSIA